MRFLNRRYMNGSPYSRRSKVRSGDRLNRTILSGSKRARSPCVPFVEGCVFALAGEFGCSLGFVPSCVFCDLALCCGSFGKDGPAAEDARCTGCADEELGDRADSGEKTCCFAEELSRGLGKACNSNPPHDFSSSFKSSSGASRQPKSAQQHASTENSKCGFMLHESIPLRSTQVTGVDI